MGNALAWIGQIVEWVGRFIPRWVIMDTTEGAVKFVCGKNAKGLGPGIHWYWPATTTLVMYPTARQADNLRTQTLVTTDDKVVVVGGMIVYEVKNVLILLSTSHSAATTIKDLALTALHDVCCRLSWDELKSEQRRGTLDTKLRRAAQDALTSYGVAVLKVMLTDLAPTRVIKLLQSTAQEEN
jgi:regulator of protease activity HflC (stomatin/prohibitin superfamily)